MNTLNKQDIGLGLVRNRVVPSTLEFNALQTRVNNLVTTNIIQGNLSVLSSNSSVTEDPSDDKKLTIDITGVNRVRVIADADNYSFTLLGGEEGVPVYFEFRNIASYDVTWSNLRTPDGTNPGLSFNNSSSSGSSSTTIMEVILLGGFYYMLNIYRQTPNYTLSNLISDLNAVLDPAQSRIKGVPGLTSSGNPITYTLGSNGALIMGTTVTTNVTDLEASYKYVLDIPKSITDVFFPGVILYYINQLESDVTNYYIKLS